MNEIIVEWQNKMKAWWSERAPREKQALLVGGSALLIYFIYAFLWSPLNARANFLRTHLLSEEKTLQWMKGADQQLSTLHQDNKNKMSSPVMLLSQLQRQLTAAGLATNVTQLKQSTNNTILLQMQQVEFDKCMQMLMALIKDNNVTISQMSATSSNAPGVVDIEISLTM